MSINVVLALGFDPWLITTRAPTWRSEGHIVISAESVEEAILLFKAGDFDMVLLGQFFPVKHRERLTFLIRATGSRTPMVCIPNSSLDSDFLADLSLRNDPSELLAGIVEFVANKGRLPMLREPVHQNEF
jgi:hypothetical protein